MSKASQDRYRRAGLCIFCGGTPHEGVQRCDKCAEKAADRQRKRKGERVLAGVCIQCGGTPLVNKHRCGPCRDYHSLTMRRVQTRLKAEVFNAYGGFVCACCGETEEAFLSIDHINNDGAEHRRQIGTGNVYRWLRDHGFPPGFQVLCMNCQWGRKLKGVCPHQIQG